MLVSRKDWDLRTIGYTYIDLFAGAGGLSEGFRRAGFIPVAHVEMDMAACNTLKTRNTFYWLKQHNALDKYQDYLDGRISRIELYNAVPDEVLNSVLNYEISNRTINDIFSKIDKMTNGNIDLIIGGPPCQAYSIAGRSRDKNRMKGDKRNYLYRQYGRFLDRYKPKYFVFENVVGLLSAKNKNGTLYINVMKRYFRSKGYAIDYRVVSADDYGIPQKRRRVIIIGKRLDKNERAILGFYPDIEKDKSLRERFSINDLFADLPFLKAGEGHIHSTQTLELKCEKELLQKLGVRNETTCNGTTFHIARNHTETDLEIYRLAVDLWNSESARLSYSSLPPELIQHNNVTSFLDRYKVVDGDSFISQTVVAHIHKDGHYYIHPDLEQNRSLTPRESARLQTFPDDYYFESVSGKPSTTQAYKQIGNAVPVLLAEKIANAMRSLLDGD